MKGKQLGLLIAAMCEVFGRVKCHSYYVSDTTSFLVKQHNSSITPISNAFVGLQFEHG